MICGKKSNNETSENERYPPEIRKLQKSEKFSKHSLSDLNAYYL